MNKRHWVVLIASGAPDDRAALREALSRDPATQYSIIEAETGAGALELSRAQEPDCVIIDHSLPDMTGLDLLKQLAAKDGSLVCGAVVLVGTSDTRLAFEAMKSGADDCIEKDRAGGEELRHAVNHAIERVEENSGEQLRLFTTVVDQCSESVLITTAQLDLPGPEIVYVNPAFTRMTGYTPEEVLGKTPRILQGPKTDRSELNRLRRDCAAGNVVRGEVINYRKDGSEFHLEWSVGPVWNTRGKITHFVSTQRDVTERRQVEEKLYKSQEEFRSLFELSSVGMTQVSTEGRYLRVNRKLCQMLGYSEQELLQLTLHEVTHPDDRDASAAKLTSSFTGPPGEYSIEKRYVRKDGAIIWVLINWAIVRAAGGELMRSIANVQDITARKLAEEALRASEAQLRAIIDNSSAVIFVKDLEGRYLQVNRYYEVTRGLTEAEIKGKTDYDLHAREIADAIRANDQKVIRADTPLQFEEQVIFSGDLHHFISVKFPLHEDSGRPYAVCGIATDITERKRAEMALQESRERLQLALEAADVGTWRVDLRTGLDTRDAALNRIIGLPEEPLTIPVTKQFEHIYPGDARRVHESWERGMRVGLYDEEHRIVQPGGKIVWVRDRGRFFYGPDRKPLYATGALADITARKQGEEARREKASLLDLTYDTVIARDPNDVITFWNRGAEEMYGWTEKEALGQVSHLLLRTIFPKPLQEILAEVSHAGRWDGELIHTRRDGTQITVASRWTSQKDDEGRLVTTLEINNDISKRKLAEEALRKSEAFNQAVLGSLAANIAVLDRDANIIAVNEAWRRFAFQNGGEAIADSVGVNYLDACRDFQEEGNDEVRRALDGIQAVLDGALPNFMLEYPCHSPSEKRWFLMTVTPLLGQRGGAVVAHTNITERKQIEEALLASEERLELAMDAGEIGTYDWNIRTNAVVWTEQSKATFGLPLGTSHGVYEDWRRRVHPEDLIVSEASMQEVFRKKGHHWQGEYRMMSADTAANGVGERWVSSQGRIFYDAQGEPLRMIGVNLEITERKAAEEALKNSTAEIHDLYNNAPCGYHSIDRDGVFVQINDTELDWLGYTREEVVGKIKFPDLLTPEGLHTFEQNFSRFKAIGMARDLEFDLVRKDGTILPVLLSATALRDHSGNYLMSRSVVYDTTARKRAEAAIRLSEARLRQLADAMPQIVYTCGPDGMADYVNQQWYEYSGTNAEQSMRSAWTETLHPDDRERTLQQWAVSVETGQLFQIEYRFRRKDGQYRWHLSRGLPMRNEQGEIVKWIGTATDIHDRKEAEAEREELLAREQAARAEAEHAAESIRLLQAVADIALGRFAQEDLLREMLGRVRQLLEADSAVIFLSTEDGQSLVVRATIGLEEAAMGFSVPIGEGVAGSIAVSRAPLILEDISTVKVINPILRQESRSLIGAPLIVEGRLIGVIHAETARARRFTESDMRLLQLAADRVALAIEQTRLYEVEHQARRQAEESNRMKDEFLALVSHELRSPLNAMLGYARLLRFGPLDAQKVKHAVDVIERSGKTQTQIIEDLLDTARIISGKLRLEVGPVDLIAVIEGAIQTIYPAADAKGITIQTDLNPKVGHQITGDPERLQQVVWNLLSNAVKFTPSGGRVEVSLDREDPHICITVSDTGKGISPGFLPYIFDRFRQADVSSTRRYGGLGLGLALVKYLVELHGGTIEAASGGGGQGTAFKVLLPVRAVSSQVAETEGPPVTTTPPEIAGSLAGVRALVVDDEDDARELVKSVIAQYGADVMAAGSAAEAFALITSAHQQKRPDVVLTDLGMPDEDGYSLLRRLREWEHERGLYTPAVALTAYGRSEDRVRALMAGFQMYLAKPVEPAVLAGVVASLINRPGRSGKT